MQVRHPVRLNYALGLAAAYVLWTVIWSSAIGGGHQWHWSALGGVSLAGLVYGTAFSRWFALHLVPFSQSAVYANSSWSLGTPGAIWLVASCTLVLSLGLMQAWILYHARVEVAVSGNVGLLQHGHNSLARTIGNLVAVLAGLLVLLAGLESAGIGVVRMLVSILG